MRVRARMCARARAPTCARPVQRGAPVGVLHFNVHSLGCEVLSDLDVAVGGGKEQRRVAVLVPVLKVCALLDQGDGLRGDHGGSGGA